MIPTIGGLHSPRSGKAELRGTGGNREARSASDRRIALRGHSGTLAQARVLYREAVDKTTSGGIAKTPAPLML